MHHGFPLAAKARTLPDQRLALAQSERVDTEALGAQDLCGLAYIHSYARQAGGQIDMPTLGPQPLALRIRRLVLASPDPAVGRLPGRLEK